MNIRLKPDTEAWLKSQVEEGHYNSIEEAVEVLVAEERLNQEALDKADLSWAKPYIEEALADLEAGRVYPAEQVHAELLGRLKGRRRT